MTDLTPNDLSPQGEEAPGPEPLSPAAQAVLDAFSNASDGKYIEGVWVVNERTMLSAAIRALADQIAPTEQNYEEAPHKLATVFLNGVAYAANEMRLVATELEAQP